MRNYMGPLALALGAASFLPTDRAYAAEQRDSDLVYNQIERENDSLAGTFSLISILGAVAVLGATTLILQGRQERTENEQ